MRPDIVIKGAVLSEKAVTLSAAKTYALKVDVKATKEDIRTALKKVFDVDAVEINTSVTRGKVRRKMRTKRSGAIEVKLPNFKKAYVRLKDDQELPTPALTAQETTAETQA